MVVRNGIDSTAPVPGAHLKAQGIDFICRYVAPQAWKTLHASEVADYAAHGVDLVLNFESAAGNAKGGFNQGVKDAHSFIAVAKSKGLNTNGITGYFSVDFDASASQISSLVLPYLRGVASVLGVEHTGVYGSYSVVKAALDHKVVKYAWSTYAWSGGRLDPRRHIHQYKNGVRVNGVDADLNHAYSNDIGAHGSTVPAQGDDLTPQEAKNLADALYQGTQVPSINGGAKVPNTAAHTYLIQHVAALEAAVKALQAAATTQSPLTEAELATVMAEARNAVASALTEAAGVIHPTNPA